MALQGTDERWTEIRRIHLDHKLFYQLGGGLLLVLIGVFIGAKLFAGDNGYFTNLYTEVLSIAVTIAVLNRLAQNREERREIKAEQQRLIRAAGSGVNDTAKSAIDEIRKRGWLTGETGILTGADMRRANLQSANLLQANLQGVNLGFANLQGVNLGFANLHGVNLENAKLQDADLLDVKLQDANLERASLQGATLRGAKLQDANLGLANLQDADLQDADLHGAYLRYAKLQDVNLGFANLQNANLEYTNLQGAKLYFVNLQSADLRLANLHGAKLGNSKFDENTTLPDNNKWTPDTDLTRFTDPDHPNFWQFG